jgi:hypothetical protein
MLVNALIIQELDAQCREVTCVDWMTDAVLRVSRLKLAWLIGVRNIHGWLFHRQGNFPVDGFVEWRIEQARLISPLIFWLVSISTRSGSSDTNQE